MGEAAASGGGPEWEVQEMEEMEVKQGKSGETDGSEPTLLTALRWERFFPKMVLRVLLVEADDSTRQIIAALLRKCSYRVAAVSDGLKAWEVLKERPKNVDLILTEVELPSISGYALLTLIMEHKICKNIPVIMMSSHDSISMVYKCMLRGAADFLVKPVRKNELRNLWQHVWRRQGGTTTDNNLNAPRNEDSIEKGSDDQNSSVKLEMDVGGDENTEQRIRSNSLPTHHNKVGDGNVNDDPAYLKSSNQAIDLIGAFENYPKCNYTSSCSKDKIKESSPPLDLSLTRNPSGSLNQFSDQKNNRLNHSDASAFTRYIKKPRNNEIGLPVPVRGVGFNGLGNAHSSIMSPIQSPLPCSAASQDSHFQTHLFHVKLNHQAISYEQSCGLVDQNTDNDTTLSEKKEHISSFTDQSANTRTSAPLVKSTEECGKEKSPLGHQQSQREAALTKFRLKRKDRCFEKKVRYESRKKLAEKRPRVKGQFIRQHPS